MTHPNDRLLGTLFGVGVGPGDPELLTVKALNVVDRCAVLAVPVTHRNGESYALNVVAAHVRPDHTLLRLHFPMTRDRTLRIASRQAAARAVAAELNGGRDVAFLTEGDPLLHSTFIHLLAHLPPATPFEIVPGVSSIAAATAQARQPLVNGDQRLAVLPATFEDIPGLRRALREFDAVVLLKVNRVLDDLIDMLTEMDLLDRAVLVERASHPAGRVVRHIGALHGKPVHYLSMVIVYARRNADED
jgi:precorrin-2/cobalt-factor-2 C20-methyltransferase